jgi:hypothetical protein
MKRVDYDYVHEGEIGEEVRERCSIKVDDDVSLENLEFFLAWEPDSRVENLIETKIEE